MELKSDLDNAIDNSANELHEHTQNKLAEKEKKKRGPKGPRTNKTSEKITSMENSAQAVKISREQYAQVLQGFFMVSGMYLAKATKFKGFEMEISEIQEVSLQGAIVCELCMPEVDAKTLAIGGFTFGVASLYGMKYMAFKEHQKAIALARQNVSPVNKEDKKD